MANSPFISIVLPTYNRLYSLNAIFLPCLEKQDYEDYELIVVDDCSTDGTKEFFEGLVQQFPKIARRCRYFKNDTNRGAPGSRNRGASLAKGPWVYIVEDDVQIDDDSFLSRASVILKDMDEKTAVVCPKRAESISKGYYKNPPHNFVRIGRLSGEVYMDPEQEYSGFVLNAQASSFIRRDIYNQFQEDEKLFFGNTFRDESDLYMRIVKSGYKIYYVGDQLKTLHRNDFAKQGGQKKVNKHSLWRQELMVWRNHYLYLKKNYTFAPLMIPFFLLVRVVKASSNIVKLNHIRDFLALLRL